MKKSKKASKKALMTALALTVTTGLGAKAVDDSLKNPLLSLKELGSGILVAEGADGACGEGSCGSKKEEKKEATFDKDGKADPKGEYIKIKAPDGTETLVKKEAAKKDGGEGSCGAKKDGAEGSCGAKKDGAEGSCGAKKDGGEGTCGAKKE